MVDESEKQHDAIVELFNLIYDSDKKILKYDVIPDNATSIEEQKLGKFTLIIDTVFGGNYGYENSKK